MQPGQASAPMAACCQQLVQDCGEAPQAARGARALPRSTHEEFRESGAIYMREKTEPQLAARGSHERQLPGRAGLIGRRDFIKLTAVSVASSGLASEVRAQVAAPAPSQAKQPAAPPPPPLGNGEAPAVQFQVYPGGTGAYLEKLVRERGKEAFDRAKFKIEPWKGRVPATEEEIAFLPVHRLAALLKARKISSVELTGIYLDRLKQFDPVLLCAVTIMEGPAREAAQQADAEIKAGKYRGPLHGIPWGLKDIFSTQGVRTTWGAKEFENRIIEEDADVSVRLREAGAVLIAKLSTGRFAQGDNWYRGRTRNPWNPEQGSSGSSAGPASAAVAGCVAFGIGSETQGSIVSPALRCGMSALRPTFGRVSRHGAMTLAWSMDKVGPLCRTIEDCALVFSIIHGADEKDPSTLTAPFQWDRDPNLSKMRIGYDAQAPKSFLDKLRELSANPKPIAARPTVRGLETLPVESAVAFNAYVPAGILSEDESRERTGRFVRGRTVTALDYLQTQRRRQILAREMAELMKDFDMYVSGSGDIVLTNQTGHPAAVLPYGFSEGERGQPQCTTIIGNLFADDKILSVAHAYQRATHWHERHPKLAAP
jgi:Asp-tRNA(Asn)/Glu-tRNA(Gln) amidotransferase A subunit family amidase